LSAITLAPCTFPLEFSIQPVESTYNLNLQHKANYHIDQIKKRHVSVIDLMYCASKVQMKNRTKSRYYIA
jgi:hypothetical protein